MKKLCLLIAFALTAPSSFAQRGVDLIVDVEGVRRTGNTSDIAPGTQQFVPDFSNGWGVGGGVNVWLTDRLSLEAKAAGFRTRLRVSTFGSDFVINSDLGHAQIYPLMAVLQWHPLEHGTVRPYIGAGGTYVILKNVNRQIGATGASGINFDDPTGLLLNAGLRFNMSNRWDVVADARYVPVESRGRTTFPGTNASVRLQVKPLIAGFGIAYHY